MFRKSTSLILALIFLLPLVCACKEEPDPYADKLVLARDGISAYRIVIPQDASEAMRASAGELQSYLEQITGVRLPVADDSTEPQDHELILGDTARSEGTEEIDRRYLGNEGFCIRNVGNSILISGKTDRGTLYGVYGFLEEYLGVRYWAEGEEYVPRLSTAAIDPFAEDNIQKPGFKFRLETHQSASSFNEKQRLNASWSGDTQPIAGGIEYTGPWYVHTFGTLLGWSASQSYRKQPCLSDNAVFDKMFASACRYIEKNPDATVISISQNDSTLAESGECTCEKCTEAKELYGSSGALLKFINLMANALKSKYPYIYVETLAYYYTQEPPKGGVTAGENVIVRFCNAGGCMMHALNAEAEGTEDFYPQNNNLAFENLKGWSEAAENLYVWEYNTDFGSTLASIPNFDRLYENIRLYHEYGVSGVYVQGMRDGGEFDRLRGYLAAKLLWDPDMSREEFDRHMSDFLTGYYGEAASDVADYIDYITQMCADTHPSMYHDTTRFWPVHKADGSVDTTHLETLLGFYDAAVAHAETYEIERRVRRALLPILYYETLLCAAEVQANTAAIEELVALNETLYDEMQLASIGYLKEGIKIPDLPNFKNTLLYWGWDGEGIYDTESAEAHEKAKEEAAAAENNEEQANADDSEIIDVTQAQDQAEQDAAGL